MIEFKLTKDLAKDLAILPKETPSQAPSRMASSVGAMVWYAHRVIIGRRKCIIAMESQSRYAMVFCGLTQATFANFPKLFKERLWREACAVTQLQKPLPAEEVSLISGLALEFCQQMEFGSQTDRSVQSHIRQVKEQLFYMVNEEAEALPVKDEDAIRFGLSANRTLRKCKGDHDYFVPLEVFRDFWLGRVQQVLGKPIKAPEKVIKEKEKKSKKIIQEGFEVNGNTVIKVDFINRCKK
ncbi:MAG: hypothetical protein V7785_00915 [Bermanella sp.]